MTMVNNDQSALSSISVDQGQIHLRKLEKTYHSAAGDFTALRDVDFTVEPGEMVAVIEY